MKAHLAPVAAGIGAWWSAPIPAIVLWVVVIAAMKWRNAAAISVAILLIVSFLGSRAIDGLSPPDAGEFDGWVTLVDDPRPIGSAGVLVTATVDGRRVSVAAHGRVAGRLDDGLAGERVHVVGTIRPMSPDDDYARWRHIVGRISVTEVVDHAAGSPVTRLANTIRRTLATGANPLSRADRAVFLGMVIGDDRGQTATVADDFRAAGLGHLLVVSGQNVAFVLAVAAPLFGRWRPAARAVGLLTVLSLFAVMTRFEPSVLRAVAMAGLGIGAAAFGNPVDGRRALSWGCAGLLVIDPFLVHLVAFQLSVAATAGIVWWSAPLALRLKGPAWWRVPFATTAAAQLGVSPLLLAIFGPLPLASLPANLLAGPVSGAVMVWGCTGGVVAGIAGGVVGEVVHIPTRAMLWWIGEVAATSARAPHATLGTAAILILGAAAAALFSQTRAIRVAGLLGAGAVAFFALAQAAVPPQGQTTAVSGVDIWVSEDATILVLDDPPRARVVLEVLREAGMGRPSLVIAVDGDRADADAVVALRARFGSVPVAAPPLHRVPGGRTVVAGQRAMVGEMVVDFLAVEPRLEVTITVDGPDRFGFDGDG